MITKFNGREVECEVQFAREVEDCFIESAIYTDTGESLTSDELDLLQDEAGGQIDEAHAESLQGAAEAWADSQQDR